MIPERVSEATDASAGQSGPVLVVDDDAVVLRMIRSALEEEGLAVVTADNGRRAIERAAHHPPALVVLDMSLPLLGGEAVAAELRARFGARLPILVITADHRPEEKARALGAYAHLAKPFDVDDLIATVRRGLQRA